MLFPELTVERTVVYRTVGRGTANDQIRSPSGDDVGCGLLPKPQPRASQAGRGYRTKFCYSNIYSMVYLLRGTGVYSTASGEEHALSAGSLFHRFPGVPHQTHPVWDGNWVEFFVAIPRNICDLALEAGLLDLQKPVWQIGKNQIVMDCMLEIHRLFQSDSYRDTLLGLEKMQSLIRIAWEQYTATDDSAEDPIDRACRLLCDESLMDEPAETIAEKVEMGFESFRKKFRKKMGISPGAFRVRHKINRACELLINSDKPVATIAQDLGYSDTFAFSHQFKKKTGIAPGAYRREYR